MHSIVMHLVGSKLKVFDASLCVDTIKMKSQLR